MAYLADTNIIVRRILPDDPHHATVTSSLLALEQQGETVYITSQSLIEFRAVATRSASANGAGGCDAAKRAGRVEPGLKRPHTHGHLRQLSTVRRSGARIVHTCSAARLADSRQPGTGFVGFYVSRFLGATEDSRQRTADSTQCKELPGTPPRIGGPGGRGQQTVNRELGCPTRP